LLVAKNVSFGACPPKKGLECLPRHLLNRMSSIGGAEDGTYFADPHHTGQANAISYIGHPILSDLSNMKSELEKD
jgi:hypothetical protein